MENTILTFRCLRESVCKISYGFVYFHHIRIVIFILTVTDTLLIGIENVKMYHALYCLSFAKFNILKLGCDSLMSFKHDKDFLWIVKQMKRVRVCVKNHKPVSMVIKMPYNIGYRNGMKNECVPGLGMWANLALPYSALSALTAKHLESSIPSNYCQSLLCF